MQLLRFFRGSRLETGGALSGLISWMRERRALPSLQCEEKLVILELGRKDCIQFNMSSLAETFVSIRIKYELCLMGLTTEC